MKPTPTQLAYEAAMEALQKARQSGDPKQIEEIGQKAERLQVQVVVEKVTKDLLNKPQ